LLKVGNRQMTKKIDNNNKQPISVSKDEDWKSKYLRALADYRNLEKRTIEEKYEIKTRAAANFILKLLPVVDILEKVEKNVHDEGLELALKQLREMFKIEGLEKIEVVGKRFDPYVMECIEVVEAESEGQVAEELRRGYAYKGKIIRVAQVKVGRKKEEIKNKETVNT